MLYYSNNSLCFPLEVFTDAYHLHMEDSCQHLSVTYKNAFALIKQTK